VEAVKYFFSFSEKFKREVEKIMTSFSGFFALFWNMGENLTARLHFSQI